MAHPILSFILFEMMILLPLVAGFIWRQKTSVTPATPKRLFWVSLFGFETPIYAFLGWGIRLKPELAFLPLIGGLTALSGLVALYWTGKRAGYTRQDLGTLAACGALSNQGYFLGGYLCLLLVGEQGLALSVIYIFYWNFLVYGVLFPIARWASEETDHLSFEPLNALRQLATDPRAIPLPGFLLGLTLNAFEIARPAWIASYLKFAPPVSSIIVLLGVGLTIEAGELRMNRRLVMAAGSVKFLLMPAVGISLALLAGLNREAFAVVVIESACPTAIFSVVISTLFAMNSRLAATLLVWTTGVFLVAICPLLIYLISGPLKP